jgi:hypothetical protein
MPDAVFALFTFNPERVVQLVVNCFAVAGGFLAGYLLTWFVARLLDRWLTGNKSPEQLHRAARIIGGIALAILIAMFVFGSGGGGNGDGSGGTPGDDKTGTTGGGGTPTVPTSNDPKSPLKTPTENPAPPEQRVRVTLLGGDDVREEKFYLVDDDAQPKAFGEVVAAVNAKKDATQKPVGVEIRFAARNAPAQDHAAVLRLARWAQANGVTVSFPADKK